MVGPVKNLITCPTGPVEKPFTLSPGLDLMLKHMYSKVESMQYIFKKLYADFRSEGPFTSRMRTISCKK